jgi:hypothetical protein
MAWAEWRQAGCGGPGVVVSVRRFWAEWRQSGCGGAGVL